MLQGGAFAGDGGAGGAGAFTEPGIFNYAAQSGAAMTVCGFCPLRFGLHKKLVGVRLCHLPARGCVGCKVAGVDCKFVPHLRIGGIDAHLAWRFSRS